jgi:hypothetical protein
MSDILNKTVVLVLNRNWQAINIRTPQDAFCQMATNAATALDNVLGNDARAEALRPVAWDEWSTLPVREGDYAVRTARGAIRVPTVIVAVNFAKVPKKRPKLSAQNIRERDGNRCQYTGRLLHAHQRAGARSVPGDHSRHARLARLFHQPQHRAPRDCGESGVLGASQRRHPRLSRQPFCPEGYPVL